MKRIVVPGGSGFLGRWLIARLWIGIDDLIDGMIHANDDPTMTGTSAIDRSGSYVLGGSPIGSTPSRPAL